MTISRRRSAAETKGGYGPQFTRAYTPDDDLMADPPGSPIPFVASTPGAKRDGLNLRSNGWLVDNFRRSGGPILWNHDQSRPAIGAGTPSIGDALRIKVRFDQEDPFAVGIESKVRRKFLRASSVGWDFTDRDGRLLHHRHMSTDYLSREAFYDLSETSIVNVPADPGALAERHWRAMRSLSRELADVYLDQERPDSSVVEHEVRVAVLDECRRLGIPVQAEPDIGPRAGDKLHATHLPALLRRLGTALLDTDAPGSPGDGSIPPAPAGIDHEAARAVLAAFPTLHKGDSP